MGTRIVLRFRRVDRKSPHPSSPTSTLAKNSDGAGLRTSEPIRLACSDVDLADSTLTIRITKFYKTRRIALSTQLRAVLAEYDANRRLAVHSRDDTSPFFTYRKGGPVARKVLEDAFLRLLQHVGIQRQNARHQPRLHDLRQHAGSRIMPTSA